MRHRAVTRSCLAIAFAGLAWVAWSVVAAWWDQQALERARQQVAIGQFAEARKWLIRASHRSVGNGEVFYLLGVCEQAADNAQAASAAWAKVRVPSPYAGRAGLARANLELERGRFTAVEEALRDALRAGGREAAAARYQLAQVLFWEGRTDEQRHLLRAGWERSPDRAGDLRDLWLVDTAALLLESVRDRVERASRAAPDDDRVWLAQAHLALLSGRYDEAGERLAACQRQRPDDPVVWRAKLRWGLAAGRLDAVLSALPHLPADRFEPAEVVRVEAWVAGQRRQSDRERSCLERLVALDPGDARALERLAVLAAEAGALDRAASLRARKTDVDRATDRYGRLLGTSGPISDFAALARLAEELGRWFDARGWWTLTAAASGDAQTAREAIARLEAHAPAAPSSAGQSLAAVLGEAARTEASPALPSRSAERKTLAFRDDAEAVGLRFVLNNGRSTLRQLPETSAGGIALLDFDGDGWLDVYALQGGPFPPDPTNPGPGDRLFRNRRDGTFEDVTERSGLRRTSAGYSHGVAVGDYDNDGAPDLFVTRWRAYALYRNNSDGTFDDVTQAAGLGGGRDWPTSAAWADLDNDGDLDLYVCHYLEWDADHPRRCRSERAGERDRLEYCTPRQFPALPDHLFRNDGGRFTDMSDSAGITAADTEGRGFGVVAADLDDDGQVDLYVANDTSANFLFRNTGGLHFEEQGLSAGAASNASGGFQAGMGTTCGDVDGDGRPDLLVTNFYGESTTYFHNLGGGLFEDATGALGLGAPSRFLLGFGIVLLDADNDGRTDVMTANGHVNDERPRFPYAMPAQLLIGGAGGRLTDVSQSSGAPWKVARLGRGLAQGDLDNDGRIDAVLVDQNAPLAFFHNQSPGGHWVTFRLEGTDSNRDGVGARVTVTADRQRWVAQRIGGGSFQAASDGRLHFGLGTSTRIESVEVRWPSGRVDSVHGLAADRGYLLKEGADRPVPLAGFASH